MNQREIIAAAIFIAGIGGGLLLRFIASSAANDIVGPNQVQVMNDGTVLAVAGEHIYVHDRDGVLLQAVATAELGSDSYVGALLALDRDTVILRDDRRVPASLERDFSSFMRQRVPPLNRTSGSGVLQRCRLSTASCEPMGNDFHSRRVFDLAASTDGKRIIAADTTAWQLVELDAAGRSLRSTPASFQFPNTVAWIGDELWVADTNNHRLALVDTTPEWFGQVLAEVVVDGAGWDFSWPIAFAPLPDGGWAVVSSNTAFDATRAYVYDDDGRLQHEIRLPRGADLLDAAVLGDEVLLADFRNFAIHAVAAEGAGAVRSFGSPRFWSDMADLKSARRRWQALSQFALVLMAGALGFLVLVYARSQRH